jgi:hypothetical protein
LPLVARSPDRPYLDSASDVSLLLDAGAPCGFEPPRPPLDQLGDTLPQFFA